MATLVFTNAPDILKAVGMHCRDFLHDGVQRLQHPSHAVDMAGQLAVLQRRDPHIIAGQEHLTVRARPHILFGSQWIQAGGGPPNPIPARGF